MQSFNPSNIFLPSARSGARIQGPYMPTNQPKPQQKAQPQQQPIGGSIQSPMTTIRASGSGPFDAAYRQNLATYAGGGYAPSSPSGLLQFNPTGSLFGNPTGAGNAPVQGAPTDLLSQALGGNPFTAQTSGPQSSAAGSLTARVGRTVNPQQQWMQQYLLNGRGYQPYQSQ